MDILEYNQYIERYFNNRNVNGALMLTSSWGRGKSYYIDNFLTKQFDGRCVKVSLYGLKSLEDISRSIYLSVRFGSCKKSEAMSYLKLIGKTISRGILGYFKINIDPREKDFQNLFESIDLSDKLIILEDVERSNIDIVQILGYVNNLCEQEKYKVLLVINEDEVINDKDKVTDYSRKKEKTVIDTLYFDCPINKPIQNILESFAYCKDESADTQIKVENADFEKLLRGQCGYSADDVIDIIKEIMLDDANRYRGKGYNLRSLIFACQKTIDFFNDAAQNNIPYSNEFFVACLFGMIAFSLKFKREKLGTLKWESDLDSPELLGNGKHPLLRVCFDYIQNHKFNVDDVNETNQKFLLLRKKDEAWRKLKFYQKNSYDDLLKTIDTIQMLIEKNIFPQESYVTIVSQLFSIKSIVGDDNNKISSLIGLIKNEFKNVRCTPYKLYDKVINPIEEVLLTNEAKSEYEAFKSDISQSLTQQACDELIELTKTTEGIGSFFKTIEICERESSNLLNKVKTEFASKIDIECMVNQLLSCSSSVIADFTTGLLKIYNIRNGESADDNVNFNGQGRKSIDEIYEQLPESIKRGTLDKLHLIDTRSQNALIELKEAIDREIENRSNERNRIESREIKAIKKLIQKLENVANEQADKIRCYQLKCLIEGLKKII